ncbi:MAG: hypothetical protein R3F37_10155 [Candidatus Competibacteraceae bacterium]
MFLQLQELAQQIDTASESNDIRGLTKVLETVTCFDRTTLTQTEQATLDFFAANAYSSLRRAKNEHNDLAWIQPTFDNEISSSEIRIKLARRFIDF